MACFEQPLVHFLKAAFKAAVQKVVACEFRGLDVIDSAVLCACLVNRFGLWQKKQAVRIVVQKGGSSLHCEALCGLKDVCMFVFCQDSRFRGVGGALAGSRKAWVVLPWATRKTHGPSPLHECPS